MKRLRWDKEARADLIALAAHYAKRDQRIAHAIIDRIVEAVESLRQTDTGRPGRMPGMREKSVQRTGYIVAYVVRADEVVILRLIHAAREWTGEQWPKSD